MDVVKSRIFIVINVELSVAMSLEVPSHKPVFSWNLGDLYSTPFLVGKGICPPNPAAQPVPQVQYRRLTSSFGQPPLLSRPPSTSSGSAHSRPYFTGGDDDDDDDAEDRPSTKPMARSQHFMRPPPPLGDRTNILRRSFVFHPLHRVRIRLRQQVPRVSQRGLGRADGRGDKRQHGACVLLDSRPTTTHHYCSTGGA